MDCGTRRQSADGSTKTKVLKTVKKGANLYYYGNYAINGKDIWFRVQYGKLEGYVFGYTKGMEEAPYLKGVTINGKTN